MSPNPLPGLAGYVQFGFLFEPDPHVAGPGPVFIVMQLIFILVSLWLLVRGLRSTPCAELERRDRMTEPVANMARLLRGLTIAAGAGAMLLVLRMAWYLSGFDAAYGKLVFASSVLPALLVVGGLLFERYWGRLRHLGQAVSRRMPRLPFPNSLIGQLALLPVFAVAAASVAVPIFTSRGVMLYTPYLLLALARGLVSRIREARVWILLALVLAVAHPLSVIHYQMSHHEDPIDYRGLAEQWLPQVAEDELVFVHVHWTTTPIFYYLDADRYEVVGADYTDALAGYPGVSIWVIRLDGLAMPFEMQDALEDHHVQDIIRARGISAVLYSD